MKHPKKSLPEVVFMNGWEFCVQDNLTSPPLISFLGGCVKFWCTALETHVYEGGLFNEIPQARNNFVNEMPPTSYSREHYRFLYSIYIYIYIYIIYIYIYMCVCVCVCNAIPRGHFQVDCFKFQYITLWTNFRTDCFWKAYCRGHFQWGCFTKFL